VSGGCSNICQSQCIYWFGKDLDGASHVVESDGIENNVQNLDCEVGFDHIKTKRERTCLTHKDSTIIKFNGARGFTLLVHSFFLVKTFLEMVQQKRNGTENTVKTWTVK